MNLIIRKASVRWKGGAEGGTRTVTTETGALKQVKFSSGTPRLNAETDPAELIAAAHASSFSLALSEELGLQIFKSGEIVTAATVTLKHFAAGWSVMNIHLSVIATLPQMPYGRFIDASLRAKTNCFVSKLLHTNISMTARLEKTNSALPPTVSPRV